MLSRDVRHAVVDRHDLLLAGNPVVECQPAVEVRDRNDAARESTSHSLDTLVERRTHLGNPWRERPSMRGEDHRNLESFSGKPAEHAGLGGVGGEQIGLDLSECGTDLPEGSEIVERPDRGDEMRQRVDRDSPVEQAVGEGTAPARDDRRLVTQISGSARQVADVDLGAPNRIRRVTRYATSRGERGSPTTHSVDLPIDSVGLAQHLRGIRRAGVRGRAMIEPSGISLLPGDRPPALIEPLMIHCVARLRRRRVSGAQGRAWILLIGLCFTRVWPAEHE